MKDFFLVGGLFMLKDSHAYAHHRSSGKKNTGVFELSPSPSSPTIEICVIAPPENRVVRSLYGKVRVRTRIPSPVWGPRRLSGKARGLRILLVWKGRATPPDRMDRRPNRGIYFCASPKVTTTFCISPCTGSQVKSFGQEHRVQS